MSRRRSRTHLRNRIRPGVLIALAAGVLTVVGVSVVVPRRTPPTRPFEHAVADGPDSYFHHVYDPGHLLGLVGDTDLALDTLERMTGVVVLVAALPTPPADDPDFALRVAEMWAPGRRNGDTGMVLFVFPNLREVRAEVGYGLEASFPDAIVAHLLEGTALPAFAEGDFPAGLKAVADGIAARLEQAPVTRATGRPIAIRAELAALVRSFGRSIDRGRDGWLAAPLPGRLILGSFAAILLAVLIGFLVQFALATLLATRFLWHRLARRDRERAQPVFQRLGAAVSRGAQILAFLFIVATGVSVFVHGSGRFGGAGVALRWPAADAPVHSVP